MNNIQINHMEITLALTFSLNVMSYVHLAHRWKWSGDPMGGILIISSCTNNDLLKLRIAPM